MKIRYSMFVALVILLSGLLFNTGSVLAQTSGPNTSFETGDNFYFNTTETRSDNWNSIFELRNDTNPAELYRYQEDYNGNDENVEGDLDLFLVKPDVNLPPFTGPEGDYDHVIIVDWSGMTVSPSTRTSSRNFFDAGGIGVWENTTNPIEDTTGRYYSNDNGDDERWMPLVSNETYIVQMSEMTENSIGFEQMRWLDHDFPVGSFDSLLPLVAREVTDTGLRSYQINGATNFMTTKMVRSTFAVTFNEAFQTQIQLGGEDDQNAPLIGVDAMVNITANYAYEYYFDSATGMIIEMVEDSSYSINLNYYNSSVANIGSNDPNDPNQGGPATHSFDFTLTMEGSKSSEQTISEASSFYGNPRTLSSGSNRIEEGNLLVYDFESENSYSFDSSMLGGNSFTTGFDRQDSSWGNFDSYGTANFDVYRHQPGGFEAVIFIEGTSSGEFGWDKWSKDKGFDYAESNSSVWGPKDFIEYDYDEFGSSNTEEIVHFFDDTMYFDDDFLYDNNKEGDDWRVDYNRDVPQSGPVNDTASHMDLTADELVNINGFDHTWFDLQMYGQKYETTYNQQVQIPVQRDEDGDVWITVQLTGTAEGEQNYYYDQNTGVLLAMEERMSISLSLEGTQMLTLPVYMEGVPPAEITISVEFHAQITIEEKFFILLAEHPVGYQNAESTDPVDHSTPSSSSTTSTTSTTSSSDDGNGAGLPVPVPIVPVLSALTVVAIYVRKRKY